VNGPAARPPLEQIRETARALLAQGQVDETWDFFLAALDAVLVKNRELELLVLKLRRERMGRHAERLDPRQIGLLFEALLAQGGGDQAIDPDAEARADAALDREIADAEQAASETSGRRRRKTRKTGPGWRTCGVDHQVHAIEVPGADRICSTCHGMMQRIGVDVTRRLEYVPGHFVEHESHREKWACGRCKDAVITAPAPPQVLSRSAADASLLAHVVVSKFADHTPLHRLHRIYARSGADIPVSTLADWVAGVGALVEPLVERLAARVREAHIVRTDATGLKVLDPRSPEHIEMGSMWGYIGDDRDVLFRYTPTGEGATGPWTFLAGRTGYVQADAATVFDRLFTGQAAHAIEVGCLAHARRKLVALQDMDCRVAYPLTLIARLYRIEHLADARGLAPDDRVALRRERSAPVLETLHRWCGLTRAQEPPSTDLAKAAGYFVNHWQALSRFLEDGRIDLDNNLCESQLRDIALGRKNFLFAGSHLAARRAAGLYSLLRTCAQYGVPPLPYLTEILTKLATGWSMSRLDELLPHRWRPPVPTSAPLEPAESDRHATTH
jgi:transposase